MSLIFVNYYSLLIFVDHHNFDNLIRYWTSYKVLLKYFDNSI